MKQNQFFILNNQSALKTLITTTLVKKVEKKKFNWQREFIQSLIANALSRFHVFLSLANLGLCFLVQEN